MIESLFENIKGKKEVRKNLIELRRLLKTEKGMDTFEKRRDGYVKVMVTLLKDDDAKVRKNAALILGEMGVQEALGELLKAYRDESQLFVRSAYLTSMLNLDYRACVPALKEREQEILQMSMTEDNHKHLNEELKLLRQLLMKLSKPMGHSYVGEGIESEVILITSPKLEELTWQLLNKEEQKTARILSGGIRVRTREPERLLRIRTVKEMLFRFCQNPMADCGYETIAQSVLKSDLLQYLEARHEGKGSWYFRVDSKTRQTLREKSQYVTRLAESLELGSNRKLLNSTSDYEIELRILEDKQGRYHVYLILHTMEDNRFDYRRYALATSMHSVRAAEVVMLARAYLKQDAMVLDTFCGTGTLMIERYRKKKTKRLLGVDIYKEAIAGAKKNAELANVPVYLVTKNFSDFVTDTRFDEILTELPAQTEKMTASMLLQLYKTWVSKLPEWIKPEGFIIACVTEEAWMKKLAKESGYLTIRETHVLAGNKNMSLMIMQYTGR